MGFVVQPLFAIPLVSRATYHVCSPINRSAPLSQTCILCTDYAMSTPLIPNNEYIVSGECSTLASGWVDLPPGYTVKNNITIKSPPDPNMFVFLKGGLNIDGTGILLQDLSLTDTINISHGKGLTVKNVVIGNTTETESAITPIVAIRAFNADVGGSNIDIRFKSSMSGYNLAAFWNCRGTATIQCNNGRVIQQEAHRFTAVLESCPYGVVDLDVLMATFGTSYESQYLNNFMTKGPNDASILRQLVFYSAYIAGALALYTIASTPAETPTARKEKMQ